MIRWFFDDTFAFFPGAVLPKELVGLKPDKLLAGRLQWDHLKICTLPYRTCRVNLESGHPGQEEGEMRSGFTFLVCEDERGDTRWPRTSPTILPNAIDVGFIYRAVGCVCLVTPPLRTGSRRLPSAPSQVRPRT